MRKIFFTIIIVLLLNISIASAHEHNFAETKQLIDSDISCDKLTNKQFEAIGDYYMEQMHPGKSHEIMDNMMGGEGSESLKQVHINRAKRLYCNDNAYIGYGMMGSGEMMGSYPANYDYSYWNIFWMLFFVAVIFLTLWIIHRFGIKKTTTETPLIILKNRFAKGKITKNEFKDMKKELGE